MQIRHVKPEDKESWRQLWLAYIEYSEAVMEDEIIETTWSRFLVDDPHESKALVEFDENGTMVGIAHYLFHRHGWLVNDVCYIQDVFVIPSCRRKGYGRALFQEIFDIAKKNDSKQVYWMAKIANDGARKLYDDFGEVSPFVRYWKGE